MNSTSPSEPASLPPELVLKALARLLRPLVRFLIRAGITFPALSELLRGLYIDVARRDLLADERARTDSRISLITGVHRKELRRHRAPEAAEVPQPVTVGSQVAARWLGDPAFADAAGRPLPLPRNAGAGPSFETLVESVTRDIRPRAVLDDWLDQGLVVVDADGSVRLQAAAFLPRPGREDQIFYFARNLHDHLEAATANVAGAAVPFLERSVHYDQLSAEAAQKLRTLAREAAQRMLLDVNRQALAIADADDAADAGERRHRVNLGVYLFHQDEAEPGA